MAMQIRKAERKKARLRSGISGPSGSGKTVSALLMAFGITGNWEKVGMIDTENGSGELYVGQRINTPEGEITIGEYMYCRVEAPYEIKKYIAAQKAMEAAGVECIVEDSLSHAWSGSGGLLDKQGKESDRTGNSYTAWRNVTPDHNLLVETILTSPCHIIATMRSKQDYVLEVNDKGKTVPKKVGMAPVQREGMEYEFTVMFDVDMKHIATTSKDRTSLFDGSFFQISPRTGKQLREWLETGVEPERDIKTRATEFAKSLDALSSKQSVIDFVAKSNPMLLELKEELPDWFERLSIKINQTTEAFDLSETKVNQMFNEVRERNLHALQSDTRDAAE